MVEVIGVTPKDWRAMNVAPVARAFKVDRLRNTSTTSEVCARLKLQYKGNPYALAQIALFNPQDEIAKLHGELLEQARKHLDSPPSYTKLEALLIIRYPELATLSPEELVFFIEKNTYR
jgi:hypothetical protein